MRLFVIGLVIGACSIALGLWLASGVFEPLPHGVRVGMVLLGGLVAILRDLHLVDLPLPERTALVPRSVFEPGLPRGALRFGIELGVGFRTRLPSTIPYVLALAVLLGVPDVRQVVFLAFGFAAGRGSAVVGRAVSRDGQRWDTAMAASEIPIARWGSVTATAALISVTATAVV